MIAQLAMGKDILRGNFLGPADAALLTVKE